jgi:hypothetical protein
MEITTIVTTTIAVASVLSAIIPEPKTKLGKRLKRLIDVLASNVGHAKNKGVEG